VTYADYCAYTIRHSDTLQTYARMLGLHELSTGTKSWKTAARLLQVTRSKGSTVPVLFAPAEDTRDIVGVADLEEVRLREDNSVVVKDFRYLSKSLRKASLRLQDGRRLSPDFIRDYAICQTPANLSQRLSGPTNPFGGTFGIFLFKNRAGVGDPFNVEYGENIDELKERARTLINAGKGKYIWLGPSDELDDSKFIEEFFEPVSASSKTAVPGGSRVRVGEGNLESTRRERHPPYIYAPYQSLGRNRCGATIRRWVATISQQVSAAAKH
jgi:hypothetical protein